MTQPHESTGRSLTLTHWLILTIAAIGFAFDIYELLMAQYIVRYAVNELTGAKLGSPEARWFNSLLLYVPAVAGGVFGLLGGYLTDLFGRRRVLTWSILLYALSAFAAGYSTSFGMLLFFRTTTFIGVCIEFVAAVAWIAELFPDAHQREKALGYTQAFSSFGGLLVSFVWGWITNHATTLPAVSMPSVLEGIFGAVAAEQSQSAWRYLLMSGVVPALPLIVIRPFLPESPVWAEKKSSGTLKRPSVAALFSPQLRRTTIVTTIMFACAYGAAFGAIQQQPQIVPGLPQVKAETDGKPAPEQKKIEQRVGAETGMVQELGGLVGRFVLAALAVVIVSRRSLLRLFQLPGLLILPITFAYFALHDLTLFKVGLFFVGLTTVAQFSFWGNYLPRVYPVHLRGTGEGFAANIGGRLLGTLFFGVTQYLQGVMPGESPTTKLAYSAAAVGLSVYLVGVIASCFLPEPSAEMPE